MREILVSKLFQELLGPRTGQIDEILENNHMPVTEFQTGILSPVEEVQFDTVRNNQVDGTIQADGGTGGTRSSVSAGYQDSSDDSEITSMVNPALHPQKTPSTMGMSFQVTCSSTPEFDICLTWARYMPTARQSPRWQRVPKYSIFTLPGNTNSVTYFDPSGNKCSKKADAVISFHIRSKVIQNGTFLISMFIVNRTTIPEDSENKSQFTIFQPQIRVEKKMGK